MPRSRSRSARSPTTKRGRANPALSQHHRHPDEPQVMSKTNNTEMTQPLPTFRCLFAPCQPEPRRRYARTTESTAVTVKLETIRDAA